MRGYFAIGVEGISKEQFTLYYQAQINEQGILLEKDGDWEEVDEEEEM